MATSKLPDPSVLSAIFHSVAFGAPPVALWLNGIFACLVACTVWITANKEESKARKIAWISVLLALYVAAGLHATLTVGWELSTVVNHATSILDEVSALGHPPRWYSALASPMELFIICVADCISIWRCWVIWGKRWVFVIFPCLCLIVSNVFGILTIIGEVDMITGPGAIAKLARSSSVPYYSLVLATTLYCTILIIVRILLVQFAFEEGANRRRFSAHYSRAIEVIVESCVVYSSALIAQVVLVDTKSTGAAWPIALLPQIAGIFPTLMLFRVMAGSARPDSSWVSTVNFRMSNVVKSTMMGSMPISFAPSADGTASSGFEQYTAKDPSIGPLHSDSLAYSGSDVVLPSKV